MRWSLPWLSDRWEKAERAADEAADEVERARADHAGARHLASEARRIREANGFTQAVRDVFGVTQ